MVDLQKIGLALFIQHYIDSQQLERKRILIIFKMVALVLLCQVGHSTEDSFDGQVFNLPHQLDRVHLKSLFQVPQNEFQRSLRPYKVSHGREVLHKCSGILVDCIVRKVHLHIVHIVVGRL